MQCSHKDQIKIESTDVTVCKECVENGDDWVHLRLCLTCSYVGCCNSSKNKHALKHFYRSEHPIIKSIEPGEDWKYCYVDEVFL